MLDGGVGILRTLPPAEQWSLEKLRRAAATLGVAWPKSMGYPEFVRSLSPDNPRELAVLTKCTMLFRGAGYLAFDGAVPDAHLEHSALAAPYAHTTAPLRRLVDRYVLEVCHALLNGWRYRSGPVTASMRCRPRWPTPGGQPEPTRTGCSTWPRRSSCAAPWAAC